MSDNMTVSYPMADVQKLVAVEQIAVPGSLVSMRDAVRFAIQLISMWNLQSGTEAQQAEQSALAESASNGAEVSK